MSTVKLANLANSASERKRVHKGGCKIEKPYLLANSIAPTGHPLVRNFARQVKFNLAGFGSCLITGYPYSCEKSFYGRLVAHFGAGELRDMGFTAMHGCTAKKGRKLVNSHITNIQGSICIIQFGNTDVSIPLRSRIVSFFGAKKGKSPLSGKVISAVDTVAINNPNNVPPCSPFTHLQWLIEGGVRWLFRMRPNSSLNSYLEEMRGIIDLCLNNSCHPIIIGPTRLGDWYSDRCSKLYSMALERELRSKGVSYIDSWKQLASDPKGKVLLNDGMHLTEYGHELICRAIVECLEDGNR